MPNVSIFGVIIKKLAIGNSLAQLFYSQLTNTLR